MTGRPGVEALSEKLLEATAGGPLSTHAGPYFGEFGGRFVPEALIAALDELDTEYHKALTDPAFGR